MSGAAVVSNPEIRVTPGMSMVYFIRRDGLIKIGYSADLLQRHRHFKGTLLGAMPGGREEEMRTHWRFGPLRVHGEWFREGPELIAFLASLAPVTLVLPEPRKKGPLRGAQPSRRLPGVVVPCALADAVEAAAAADHRTVSDWIRRVTGGKG